MNRLRSNLKRIGLLCLPLILGHTVHAEEVELLLSAEDIQALTTTEAELGTLLQDTLASGGSLVGNRSALPLSAPKAAMMALEKNISLQRSQLSDAVAEATLLQARAVFDPVIKVSIGYENLQINTREESVRRFQSQTELNDEGENVLIVEEAQDPRVPIVVYSDPRNEGFVDSTVFASQEPISGDETTLTLGAGLEQVLPWGGSLTIAYSAINQDTFFINNPQLISANNEAATNLVGFGSYDRPWVSELLANMSMPVPGTRDFGDYSPANLNRQTALLSRESSSEVLRNVVSETLLQADLAYWDVVESALALLTLNEGLNSSQLLSESTTRLFNQRSATNYDLAQSELLLANNRTRQRQLWSSYTIASDRLALLLDAPANSLIIPEGFMPVLSETAEIAESTGIEQHPEYLGEKYLSDITELTSKARQQATRADVSFDIDVALRQSNQIYGYKSLGDSLSSVFEPDVLSKSVGLVYNYPVGNKRLTAESREAEAQHQQSTLTLRGRANALNSNLKAAEIGLQAATHNVRYFSEAAELAEESYTSALRNQASRTVKEYELAGLHSTYIDARLNFLSAIIDVKRAETRLLDAQGVLSEQQGLRLSNGRLQRLRLSSLREHTQVDLFLPQGSF